MKYDRLLLIVAGALLVISRPADSHMPTPEMQFTTYGSALPGEFISGRLGVLRPSYNRGDLLLAYRILSGVPLKASEPEPRRLGIGTWKTGPALWIETRKTVPGMPAIDSIDADKTVSGEEYDYYPNCLEGAFDNAATTLSKRIAKWGAANPLVAEWVRAQDQVFQNCAAGPVIPEALNSGDSLMVADRNYQIAAAKFYAEQLSEAESGFDGIGSDKSSPWSAIAPYLAARACIRQGTIGGNLDKLEEAAKRLRAILNDPAQKQLHVSAQGLLDFVRARLEPEQRLVELGNQLMQPGPLTELRQVIEDYRTIWYRMEIVGEKPPVEESDVADWIATFQKGGAAAAKWRKKRTLPWLVAALVWARGEDQGAQDLISAAHAIRPGTPGYASVTYYGIRNQIRAGKLDAARQWADSALGNAQANAVTNLLNAERLSLARNWTEFLHFAPRTAVEMGDTDGEYPMSAGGKPVAFDADFVRPFNTMVPLKLWLDAADSESLPQNLRVDIMRAAWVRAVILRNRPAARAVAERMHQADPELSADMRAYLAERDPAAADFLAVFLMLRAPGLEPTLRDGLSRSIPVLKLDQFRDNWWELPNRYSNAPEDGQHPTPYDLSSQALYDLYPDGNFGPSDFLPKDQRASGEAEWKQLTGRADAAANYLCPIVFAWAHAHPQDPRVPQALHLAVNATHYGPNDETTSTYSKQAFDLLHRRYPNSEWTKKTKFWY
jgi:hypothetical protein